MAFLDQNEHHKYHKKEVPYNLYYYFSVGGFIYFMAAVEYLHGERQVYENHIRKLQDEGIWRWVLMKESPDEYYKEKRNSDKLILAFKVLK